MIQRKAWIAEIRVSDPDAPPPPDSLLDLPLRRFLEANHYFSEVGRLSAASRPEEEDLLLRFDLDEYRFWGSPHWALIPGSIATLGLYIITGLPVYRDHIVMGGELVVSDGSGSILARSRSRAEMSFSRSLYGSVDREADLVRSQLVAQLLEQATQGLTTQSAAASATHSAARAKYLRYKR